MDQSSSTIASEQEHVKVLVLGDTGAGVLSVFEYIRVTITQALEKAVLSSYCAQERF